MEETEGVAYLIQTAGRKDCAETIRENRTKIVLLNCAGRARGMKVRQREHEVVNYLCLIRAGVRLFYTFRTSAVIWREGKGRFWAKPPPTSLSG